MASSLGIPDDMLIPIRSVNPYCVEVLTNYGWEPDSWHDELVGCYGRYHELYYTGYAVRMIERYDDGSNVLEEAYPEPEVYPSEGDLELVDWARCGF